MDDFGFIITRHVNTEKTNQYWNHNVKLLEMLYPDKKIVVVDDNSNYNYVKDHNLHKNIIIIQSEFKGRGELLPYYYFLKHRFFKNAIIIHDSVFFHKKIAFEKLNGLNVLPLWHFKKDTENVENTMRLVSHLKNNYIILNKINDDIKLGALGMSHNKWFGCFGVQTYINLHFLQQIQTKYNLFNLIHVVKCRNDRCCLERIFGIIFSNEIPYLHKHPSLFGDIKSYQKWGYSFDQYMIDFNKGLVVKYVVKVWTGR